MRRLLMSRLIRIFTVCLVNLFFIQITELWNKQGGCPNIPDFTLYTIDIMGIVQKCLLIALLSVSETLV